jgi:hypothetical protein
MLQWVKYVTVLLTLVATKPPADRSGNRVGEMAKFETRVLLSVYDMATAEQGDSICVRF